MKKKKIIILIITLIILLILCKQVLSLKNNSYSINVDGTIVNITEKFEDNYYAEVEVNKKVFPFRIFSSLERKKKAITDIHLYQDKELSCVLPIFSNKVYVDMICYKDNILYDYSDLMGDNKNLDDYVSNISLYDSSDFKDQFNKTNTIDTIKYNASISLNNSVAITNYKGLVINGTRINLFKKDIYDNYLSTFVDNYYVVANYDDKYSFNYFYVVNLKNNEITKIKTKDDISYDSYIQGTVDDKIYLYDRNNEVQYEINPKDGKIKTVSDGNYVKYYSNNKWEKINKTKANKVMYFDYSTLDNNFSNYDVVKETKYFYYLFKKDGIYYKLYRIDKDNISIYKYIANVPVTNIIFNDEYLYYVYKTYLYYYSDNTGFKTVLENSELEFNDTIKYYIY